MSATSYSAPTRSNNYSAQFVVQDASNNPITDFSYVLVDSVGNEYRGRTNDSGETQRHYFPIFTRVELYPDDANTSGYLLEEHVCTEC